MASKMFVVKRSKWSVFHFAVAQNDSRLPPPATDGRQETVMFDKITSRISKLCYGLNADFIEPVSHFQGLSLCVCVCVCVAI